MAKQLCSVILGLSVALAALTGVAAQAAPGSTTPPLRRPGA